MSDKAPHDATGCKLSRFLFQSACWSSAGPSKEKKEGDGQSGACVLDEKSFCGSDSNCDHTSILLRLLTRHGETACKNDLDCCVHSESTKLRPCSGRSESALSVASDHSHMFKAVHAILSLQDAVAPIDDSSSVSNTTTSRTSSTSSTFRKGRTKASTTTSTTTKTATFTRTRQLNNDSAKRHRAARKQEWEEKLKRSESLRMRNSELSKEAEALKMEYETLVGLVVHRNKKRKMVKV